MLDKINLKAITIIIFISIVLGFIYNGFSSDGIPLIREAMKVTLMKDISESENSAALRGLHISEVVNLHNIENVVFIDARDQWDYSEGHIARAINIPEFSFDPNNKMLEEIDKEELIIVYCDGNECDTSKRLASEMIKLGFKNVFIYLGGFSEWSELKLPIEKVNTDE